MTDEHIIFDVLCDLTVISRKKFELCQEYNFQNVFCNYLSTRTLHCKPHRSFTKPVMYLLYLLYLLYSLYSLCLSLHKKTYIEPWFKALELIIIKCLIFVLHKIRKEKQKVRKLKFDFDYNLI